MTMTAGKQATLAQAVRDALGPATNQYGHGIEIHGHERLGVSCDQMSALAGHVTRDYGDYGYAFEELRQITHAVVLAQVRHLDGSRFILAADKWGNVLRLDNSGLDAMAAGIAAMHANAVAV